MAEGLEAGDQAFGEAFGVAALIVVAAAATGSGLPLVASIRPRPKRRAAAAPTRPVVVTDPLSRRQGSVEDVLTHPRQCCFLPHRAAPGASLHLGSEVSRTV